jgi:hypothetical protein
MTEAQLKRYKLIDKNNNEFQLENGTLQPLEDGFPIDVDIIERSFTEGAIAPGEQRGTSKEWVLNIAVNKDNDISFRNYVNELFYQFRVAKYIRDTIFNIQTEIRTSEPTLAYDAGGYLRGANITISLIQLVPFWEDVNFIEVSETNTGGNQLIINNDGYFKVKPIAILKTSQIIEKFLVKVEENGEGLGIADPNFGAFNLETYVIDCINGEAVLGGILSNGNILGNTGFFTLERGVNTVNCFTQDNRDLDMTIKYKRRFFI